MRFVDISSPINWESPLNRGLLRWWLCLPNQNHALTWRELTRRSDMTMGNGAAAEGARERSGGFGCHAFYGSSPNYGQTAAIDLTAVTKLTIAFWAMFTNNTTANQVAIETTASSSANANAIYFNHRQGANVTQVRLRGTSANSEATFNYPAVNTWNHYVWTIDISAGGQPHIVYMNGVSRTLTYTSTSQNATSFGNHVWNFGARNAASLFCNSKMDDIRIFNGIKRPSEAVELWRASKAGNEDELNWIPSRKTRVADAAVGSALLKRMQTEGLFVGSAV